ncbi:MAG: PEP-CTERM sorting domain-containing protein [Fuerstiella sp.]
MKPYVTFQSLTFALLFLPTSIVDAGFVTYSNRAAWESTVGNHSTEDFNSFTVDTPFHTNAVDVGDFSLSMTGDPGTVRNKIDVPNLWDSSFNIDGTNVASVFLKTGDSLFLIFDAAIVSFGAEFAALNDSVRRVDIVVAGEVFTPPVTAASQVRFFGFTSDVSFTSVELRGVGTFNDGFSLDNVSFSEQAPVPEPASLAMWGLGAIVLTGYSRRKRKLAA